jgi:hypothetical protein
VDAERDHLFNDLGQTGQKYDVDNFHSNPSGHNGGGDAWITDGRLFVGVIKPSEK